MTTKSVFKNLLPSGIAMGEEAKIFHAFLDEMALEFDRVKKHTEKVFNEIPGQSLDEKLEKWAYILGFKVGDKEEKNKLIAAKLVAIGGQSSEYISEFLKKYSDKPDEVKIFTRDGEEHFMRIEGAEVQKNHLRMGGKANESLLKWTRNEGLIKGFELIKHAEVEARYY